MGMLPLPFASTFARNSLSLKASPLAKLVVVVTLLASVTLSECLEQDQPAANQRDKLRELLGKRLVRRNFLRFGKRSGYGDDMHSNQQIYGAVDDNMGQAKRDGAGHQGPGEEYVATLMGKHPHQSSPRSFLRFGKRSPDPAQLLLASDILKRKADNFLRFGKSMLYDAEAAERDRWMQKLLLLLQLRGEEDGHEPGSMAKKANDFLRFG